MFEGIFLAFLILTVVVGGKALLIMLTTQPLIGPLAAWYMDHVGPLGDGMAANMVYGFMTAQLLFIPLLGLLFGPGLVRKSSPIVSRYLRVLFKECKSVKG